MRLLDCTTNAMDINLSKLREMVRIGEVLACCSPRGCKESDMTGQLNNDNLMYFFVSSWLNI